MGVHYPVESRSQTRTNGGGHQAVKTLATTMNRCGTLHRRLRRDAGRKSVEDSMMFIQSNDRVKYCITVADAKVVITMIMI